MSYQFAVIVGASSGIGKEIALQLAESGCKVMALARREDRLIELGQQNPNIQYRVHDVTHFDEIPGLFIECSQALGGLDLVVYCSGVMPPVEPDEYNFTTDRNMLEINLLGAVGWLNQAAVRFGQAGHGTILVIGSVAGDRG